jgi:hypothetical protein
MTVPFKLRFTVPLGCTECVRTCTDVPSANVLKQFAEATATAILLGLVVL